MPPQLSIFRGLCMGFLNYYRRYIGNFSRIAQPIYDLVKVTDSNSTGATTARKHNSKRIPTCIMDGKSSVSTRKIDQMSGQRPSYGLPQPKQSLYSAYRCFRRRFRSGALPRAKRCSSSHCLWVTYANSEKNYHLYSGKLEFLALK